MIDSIYSLIPPILVIVMVLWSKKVLPSISLGIVAAALLLNNLNPLAALQSMIDVVISIFYVDGALNLSNLFLMGFLFLLGIITSYIAAMGGTRAFARWAQTHIKNRVGAQLIAFVLGVVIFIDDYFNALTVGEIARPLTDHYGVSREKLSYIIDSTSAPICVISPISSWGAYIIALISTIFVTFNIPYSGLVGFMSLIPFNFYAIISLLMVLATILLNLNFGQMRQFEDQMQAIVEEQTIASKAKPMDLLFPIILLIAVTLGMIFLTGYQSAQSFNILLILENASTNLSLFVGAAVALLYTLLNFKKAKQNYAAPFKHGFMSMIPAVTILVFAWTLVDLIAGIGTGTYLANVLAGWDFNPGFLPVMLFLVSGVMALSTGTSWGTFGLMLPIGAQIAMSLHPQGLVVSLAAVLAGAVFGDHCSPISDTTILSATGAKCDLINHVTSQLPYAIFSASLSSIGFVVAGFTNSMWLSLTVVLGCMAVSIIALKTVLTIESRKSA
ncbi:MAG: Na+/H+ antiporter NhaC family protein [Erysipelotrichaceae bacterium]